MAVEVGNILEGKVTGITDFGAFIELPDGKSGMVHISEVAPVYVSKISEFLKEGQTVKVKVLSVNEENGKISLSIKKASENIGNRNRIGKGERNDRGNRKGGFNDGKRNNGGRSRSEGGGRRYDKPRQASAPAVTSPGDFEWHSSKKNEASSFEDLMSKFKQSSEEKFSDLKRNSDISVRRPRRNQKP